MSCNALILTGFLVIVLIGGLFAASYVDSWQVAPEIHHVRGHKGCEIRKWRDHQLVSVKQVPCPKDK